MDEKATQLLQAFVEACPRRFLRSDDWERLYAFTLYVHGQRLGPAVKTVRDYLMAHGCSLQKASWVSAEYKHFAELLTLYDQHKVSRVR